MKIDGYSKHTHSLTHIHDARLQKAAVPFCFSSTLSLNISVWFSRLQTPLVSVVSLPLRINAVHPTVEIILVVTV